MQEQTTIVTNGRKSVKNQSPCVYATLQQPTQERRRSISSRPIVKKEKKERACAKKEDSIERLLPELPPEVKKIQSWIYSEEDFTAREETEEEEGEAK